MWMEVFFPFVFYLVRSLCLSLSFTHFTLVRDGLLLGLLDVVLLVVFIVITTAINTVFIKAGYNGEFISSLIILCVCVGGYGANNEYALHSSWECN